MKTSVITLIVSLATIIISPIWRGFVISKLWLWFIVSTFGAVPLGIAQSIGLGLLVSFLTHQVDTYEDKDKSDTERLFIKIGVALLAPAFALLFGWIVKGFLG
jgi:putative flippase GtrA